MSPKSIGQTLLLCSLMLSCTSTRRIPQTVNHPSGWSDQVIALCEHAWPIAQLANNSYEDEDALDISDQYTMVRRFEDKPLHFNAVLYRYNGSNNYVLAYRGTDGLKDFKTGNNPVNQLQNEHGLAIFDTVRASLDTNSEIIVAGHSLGGGIATGVSLNRANVTSYSFNGSPVFKKKNQLGEGNKRYSIVENGEILKLTRIFGREPDQIYTSLNLTPKGDPVTQHSIKKLAVGLAQIAAIKSNTAENFLQKNNLDSPYRAMGSLAEQKQKQKDLEEEPKQIQQKVGK